ncbi:tigger transposable element-derived protein 6-like [Rhizophagus irregularis DAOM 181602=DAOM 197198]|nr:tigger transposable element-derived protein 6-like [Rhizophagus irregularis DAOM 181602=DAOM 197198]
MLTLLYSLIQNITLSNSNIFHCHFIQFSELNKALQIWTSQAVAAGLPLTDTILQQKGLELAQMLNISEDQFLGEASSAPLTTLPEEQLKLRNLLAAYNEKDIYNADEMELFFK